MLFNLSHQKPTCTLPWRSFFFLHMPWEEQKNLHFFIPMTINNLLHIVKILELSGAKKKLNLNKVVIFLALQLLRTNLIPLFHLILPLTSGNISIFWKRKKNCPIFIELSLMPRMLKGISIQKIKTLIRMQLIKKKRLKNLMVNFKNMLGWLWDYFTSWLFFIDNFGSKFYTMIVRGANIYKHYNW